MTYRSFNVHDDCTKPCFGYMPSSNGLCSGIGNKEVKKEEIRKNLKYIEHVLDIEN